MIFSNSHKMLSDVFCYYYNIVYRNVDLYTPIHRDLPNFTWPIYRNEYIYSNYVEKVVFVPLRKSTETVSMDECIGTLPFISVNCFSKFYLLGFHITFWLYLFVKRHSKLWAWVALQFVDRKMLIIIYSVSCMFFNYNSKKNHWSKMPLWRQTKANNNNPLPSSSFAIIVVWNDFFNFNFYS